jgi:hypothetical protein
VVGLKYEIFRYKSIPKMARHDRHLINKQIAPPLTHYLFNSTTCFIYAGKSQIRHKNALSAHTQNERVNRFLTA